MIKKFIKWLQRLLKRWHTQRSCAHADADRYGVIDGHNFGMSKSFWCGKCQKYMGTN